MQPRCDFCNDGLVFGGSWRFACDDFEIVKPDGRVQVYVEDWSACPTCKGLIVAGKRDELAERAATKGTGQDSGRVYEIALASVREIQDAFWTNRTGPPRLDTKEEFDAPITRGDLDA